MQVETSVIYVDIDSLFDLRQARLLYYLDKENKLDDKVYEYLGGKTYNIRSIDLFPFIDKETYNNLNIKEIFKYTHITYIAELIRLKVDNLAKKDVFFGKTKVPQVLVNTYPFRFTIEEKATIQDALFSFLKKEVIIDIIEMDSKELSPIFIKSNNIYYAFIYDISYWFNHHLDNLDNFPIPETVIYTPTLYKEIPHEDDLRVIKENGFKDPFTYMEFLLTNKVILNYLPVFFYSHILVSKEYIEKFSFELIKSKGQTYGNTNTEI